MMTLTEKAAYIKGLVEGMDLDEDKKETKIINALVDIIGDIALSVSDNEDELAVILDTVDTLDESIDVIDSNLADLEDVVYSDFYDDFCSDCKECDIPDDDTDVDIYEIECPECGKVFNFDDSVFDSDEPLTCPGCGYVIDEIEIDDDEES